MSGEVEDPALRRKAEAGSCLAALELAKQGADPQARALLDLMQERRRAQLLAAILADFRRRP